MFVIISVGLSIAVLAALFHFSRKRQTALSHRFETLVLLRELLLLSTASFLPGPLQAVYYATKSFVTSFSQAIAQEVESSNITVTALCLGTVKTGFVEAGNLKGVDAWKNAKSAESVAQIGYQAMEKGQLVAFNEKGLKFILEWLIPLLPRKMVLKMSRQSMEKQ